MPVFHQKPCSHWPPSANKIDTNNMKSTWPMRIKHWHTQYELYSNVLAFGLLIVRSARLCFWSARFHVWSGRLFGYQHVGIDSHWGSRAWRWRSRAMHWRSRPTQGPNTKGFFLLWNIGFTVIRNNVVVLAQPMIH